MKTFITLLVIVSIISATTSDIRASEPISDKNTPTQLVGIGPALFVLLSAGIAVGAICAIYKMAKLLNPTPIPPPSHSGVTNINLQTITKGTNSGDSSAKYYANSGGFGYTLFAKGQSESDACVHEARISGDVRIPCIRPAEFTFNFSMSAVNFGSQGTNNAVRIKIFRGATTVWETFYGSVLPPSTNFTITIADIPNTNQPVNLTVRVFAYCGPTWPADNLDRQQELSCVVTAQPLDGGEDLFLTNRKLNGDPPVLPSGLVLRAGAMSEVQTLQATTNFINWNTVCTFSVDTPVMNYTNATEDYYWTMMTVTDPNGCVWDKITLIGDTNTSTMMLSESVNMPPVPEGDHVFFRMLTVTNSP